MRLHLCKLRCLGLTIMPSPIHHRCSQGWAACEAGDCMSANAGINIWILATGEFVATEIKCSSHHLIGYDTQTTQPLKQTRPDYQCRFTDDMSFTCTFTWRVDRYMA
ncbi:hypothetical protein ABBQ38_004294 [Trebouxia sp. C0009 RCD-2024]